MKHDRLGSCRSLSKRCKWRMQHRLAVFIYLRRRRKEHDRSLQRLEASFDRAIRLEAMAIRLEAIAFGFLFLLIGLETVSRCFQRGGTM